MNPTATAPSADDLALQIPPIIVSPGPEYADDRRAFQGIPGIERAPNGRLWAAWYSGGPTEGPWNYVLLATSGDDGETWSRPQLVIDPRDEVRAFDPCLWLDPQKRLWLFWAQGYSHWDGRAGVWAMVTEEPDAATPTWSTPRRLCDGIMMNKPVVLSTGELLLPAAVWSHPPNAKAPEHNFDLGPASGSNAIVSSDLGTTWTYRGGSQVPERSCDEHIIVERRDGSLWMLVRTDYGIGESFSHDDGKSWSAGQPSSIAHVPHARFFVRRLASGRLLLVKHDPPDGRTRSHLKAYLSDDDGISWSGSLLIDERADVSYPDATEAPDGTIYLIHDYSRTGAKEILMTVFTEADVAAGYPVSNRIRSRVLVNRATGTASV